MKYWCALKQDYGRFSNYAVDHSQLHQFQIPMIDRYWIRISSSLADWRVANSSKLEKHGPKKKLELWHFHQLSKVAQASAICDRTMLLQITPEQVCINDVSQKAVSPSFKVISLGGQNMTSPRTKSRWFEGSGVIGGRKKSPLLSCFQRKRPLEHRPQPYHPHVKTRLPWSVPLCIPQSWPGNCSLQSVRGFAAGIHATQSPKLHHQVNTPLLSPHMMYSGALQTPDIIILDHIGNLWRTEMHGSETEPFLLGRSRNWPQYTTKNSNSCYIFFGPW